MSATASETSAQPCGCDLGARWACARHFVHLDDGSVRLRDVRSSNVAAVGHCAATQTLVVEYHGGGRYAYDGVTAQKYADLLRAPSVGSFVEHQVKRAGHLCRRLPVQPPIGGVVQQA